jgi:hypothetical protein
LAVSNYPNPFNPYKIVYILIIRGNDNVVLKVYDILGREITTLVNENLQPGTYETEWDAENYPSGVYFYKLHSSGFTQSKRMVMLK